TALEPCSPMVTGARRVARGSPDLAGRGRRARYGITLSAAAPEVARAVVAPAPHGPAPDARGGCDGDERGRSCAHGRRAGRGCQRRGSRVGSAAPGRRRRAAGAWLGPGPHARLAPWWALLHLGRSVGALRRLAAPAQPRALGSPHGRYGPCPSTVEEAMDFDLHVVGSGPGGYHAAIRAAQLGLNVACVEKGDVGGVCLNVGCIPTKALLHVGAELRGAKSAKEFGIDFGEPKVDLGGIEAWKQKVVGKQTNGVKMLFRGNKVTLIEGEGRFTGPNEIEVAGEKHTARSFIVATG